MTPGSSLTTICYTLVPVSELYSEWSYKFVQQGSNSEIVYMVSPTADVTRGIKTVQTDVTVEVTSFSNQL